MSKHRKKLLQQRREVIAEMERIEAAAQSGSIQEKGNAPTVFVDLINELERIDRKLQENLYEEGPSLFEEPSKIERMQKMNRDLQRLSALNLAAVLKDVDKPLAKFYEEPHRSMLDEQTEQEFLQIQHAIQNLKERVGDIYGL